MKSNYSLATTQEPRSFSNPFLGLLAVAILTVLACSSASANAGPPVQILMPPGTGMPEGGGPVQLDFKVLNNTNMPLILDYAFCSIAHGGPDTADFANFSGKNGDAGLVSGALIIAPGQIGDYIYSFSSPGDGTETDHDFGLDPVTFAIEMSDWTGHTPPPRNTINSKIGFVAWMDFGPLGNPPNQVALNDLFNFMNPQNEKPPNNLLYSNGLIGMCVDNFKDGKSQPCVLPVIKVSDTPEPSSLLLLGSGIVGLSGVLRRCSLGTNRALPVS